MASELNELIHQPLRLKNMATLAALSPREPLEFTDAQLRRIADHAALGATERKIHHGALPRHPCRQRPYFVEIYVRRITNAALRWPTREIVLHAEALEDPGPAVVHRDGNRDLDRLLALGEDADQVRVDTEGLSDPTELCLRQRVGVLAKVARRLGGAHRLLRAPRTTRVMLAGI